jgi:hypothetical protein
MQYIDLTPTWAEILPTWRMIVGSVLDGSNTSPDDTMASFWAEMARMAQAADMHNAKEK